MPKATKAAARNVKNHKGAEPGTNGWPTGYVSLKAAGEACGPVIRSHISDYPEEEQARMMSLFRKEPVKHQHIASNYGDRLKQARRNAQ